MADIRIKDLPDEATPSGADFVPIDLVSTRKTTVTLLTEAGRPAASQAEAEAGTNPTKAMTPLTTAQAIAAQGATQFQPIDTDLTAVASLTSNGIAARVGSGSWVTRSIVGTADQVSVINGDAVVANPTISLAGTPLSLANLSLASGDILYATGATTLARLAAGVNGQALTLTAGVPSWQNAGTGDIVGPVSSVNGRLAVFSGTTGKLLADSSGKLASDVVTGPASAVNGRLAIFNGTTGKIIQDGGLVTNALVDVSAAIVDTKISYLHPGAAAVARTGNAKASDILSVKDWNAKGDNSTDDTAAIIAAIAAADTLNCNVYFPAGVYRYTSLGNIPASVMLIGAGKNVAFLRRTTGTGNAMSLNGGLTGVEGITFDATVTQTAGSYLNITTNGSRVPIAYCDFSGAFRAIIIPDPIALVDLICCDFADTVATTGVDVEVNGGFAVLMMGCTFRNDPGARPFAHISVANVEDLTFIGCQLISGGVNLNIAPGNGQAVGLIKAIGTQFDNAGTVSIRAVPTGTGTINEISIDSQWIYGISQDVLISNSGGGTVNSVQIVNSLLVGSAVGIEAIGVGNIMVQNNRIGGHSTAVSFADVSGGLIQGNIIGPHGVYGANTTGVSLTGTTDNVVVSGNKLTGNTTALINSSSGTANTILGNAGFPTLGGAAISLTASPMIVTAGSTPERVWINAGTVTLIELDDAAGSGFVGVLQSGNTTVDLSPNQRMRMTYTGTPSLIRYKCK